MKYSNIFKLTNSFLKFAEEDPDFTLLQNILKDKSSFINKFEKSEFKKENINKKNLAVLEKYESNLSNPYFFMHFSDDQIGKGHIGINTKFPYAHPVGIYSYPVTTNLEKIKANFATNKKYVFIFSMKNIFNIKKYSNSDLETDISKISSMYPEEKKLNFKKWSEYSYNGMRYESLSIPFEKLLNITKMVTGKPVKEDPDARESNPAKWNALFRELGYTNFYDPGFAIVHKDNPCCAVLFDPSQLIPITKIDNPFNTHLKEFKIDRNKKIILDESENSAAIEYDNHRKVLFDTGEKQYLKNGKLHREDGPALISNHSLQWYKDGILHRENGPAIERKDGSKEWWVNGKLNREDGPAIMNSFGSKFWYKDGKYHKLNGPAVEFNNGEQEWYVNGKRHRLDGPAVEYIDVKEWYKDGKLHRDNGPAIEREDGSKFWYKDGKKHRLDGPAVEAINGVIKYYINGIELSENEFNQLKVDSNFTGIIQDKNKKTWYKNGKKHREDGPAVEWSDGRKHYYINNNYVNEEEFNILKNNSL